MHLQGHAAVRGQAEHHLAQGGYPSVVAVCEGGKCSRLQAANTARRGTELRGGARTQSRRVEVREHCA